MTQVKAGLGLACPTPSPNRIPAVSLNITGYPPRSMVTSRTSRVVPMSHPSARRTTMVSCYSNGKYGKCGTIVAKWCKSNTTHRLQMSQ